MSQPDLAVGISSGTMNAALAAVYQNVYPKVFTGSQQVSRLGVEFTVSWDISVPPTVNLESSSTSQVQLLIPSLKLTLSGGGVSGSDTASVAVQVQINGTNPVFQVLSATATCQNASDQWLINALVIPQAISLANQILAGVTLPALSFPGLQLTPPIVAIQGGRVILLANLAGSPPPNVPAPQDWPSADFFALLSDAARLSLAQSQTAGFSPTFGPVSDKVGSKLGAVRFSASAALSNLRLTAGSAGSTSYGFTVDLSGSVDAEVSVLFVHTHVHYRISANTGPSGTISLSIEGGNQVVATVVHLDNFIILLTPEGSVMEKILSAITYPVSEAVLAAFSPLITKKLQGVAFTVWSIPSIPINLQGVTVTLNPSQLALSTFNSMMCISGSVTVSGDTESGDRLRP